ncbi:MAG: flagellin [Planctomycetota bacterium]
MALRINTNVAAISAQNALQTVTERLMHNYNHLSTGLRIASAADDAAGLAISERLRAQIRSLGQAQRNANDGISLAQTGEGAMNEISNILVRMRELAIQSNNGTLASQDRDALQQEFGALRSEIDRISKSTTFNGLKLLDGTNLTVTFQIGSGVASGVDTLTLNLVSVLSSDMGLSTLDIGSTGNATTAIGSLDDAVNLVSQLRGTFGAVQNRLGSTVTNLGVSIENLSAAESRIRDVDVAAETADLTRNSILQQAATAMLAQANVGSQLALRLLG